jgi:hypothetical protein
MNTHLALWIAAIFRISGKSVLTTERAQNHVVSSIHTKYSLCRPSGLTPTKVPRTPQGAQKLSIKAQPMILNPKLPHSAPTSITSYQVLALDRRHLSSVFSTFGSRAFGQFDGYRMIVVGRVVGVDGVRLEAERSGGAKSVTFHIPQESLFDHS